MPVVKIARSKVLWTALALMALYWPVALSVDHEDLFEVINGVLLAIAVTVMVAYLPVAYEALTQPRMERVHQLVLGIMVTWFGTALFRVWGIISRSTGSPEWMRNSPVLGFILYLLILGGVLHITAPETVDDRVPRRTWIAVGIACALGGLVAGFVIGSRRWLIVDGL